MMHSKMISVAKIHNGYLIEVRAPYKIKKDKGGMMGMDIIYGEKEIYAKNADDLGKKITKLIPMLEEEFNSKDAFEDAFEEMANE